MKHKPSVCLGTKTRPVMSCCCFLLTDHLGRDLEERLCGRKGAENGAKTFPTVGFMHARQLLLREDGGRVTASELLSLVNVAP